MTDLAVIMSIYHADRLKFVKESVESILNQNLTNFDYYIVFDGPVDNDIASYVTSLRDPRLILHKFEENKGLAIALNYLLGLLLERPDIEFIARMDADDVSMPDRFLKQRDFLLRNNDISCVGSWFEEIDEYGHHILFRKLPVDHASLKKRYMFRTPFAHSSVVYRREFIEKAGLYPVNTVFMEDNVLWGRAMKTGMKFANIPEYLLKYRKDKDFFSRRSGFKYGWEYIKTRNKINSLCNLPLCSYILTFFIGVSKMLPSTFGRVIYHITRKL